MPQQTRNQLKKEKKEYSFLSPGDGLLIVDGSLFYTQSSQAWNLIRLKREILNEFPALKDKRNKLGYKMVIPRSVESSEEYIKSLKEKNVVPIFLLFSKNPSEST